ncbi:hypothetical protein C5167_046997 [Papaver somniferum]|uniref:Uncharacterized protein n=1 Tax=Papaver somniferum TaxID=3469 RepID=A0A4Y7LIZ2_PAPSO|nr:hypothetical protein C5167_046997 [Papaver somniferum]
MALIVVASQGIPIIWTESTQEKIAQQCKEKEGGQGGRRSENQGNQQLQHHPQLIFHPTILRLLCSSNQMNIEAHVSRRKHESSCFKISD